jgi:hypothetical protein
MRAILLKGQSQYDATRVFVDELSMALARRGIAPTVIDAVTEADIGGALARASAGGDVAFLYSICIGAEWRDHAGRSLGQIVGAPHLVQHVDYPLTHAPRLEQASADTVFLTVDPTHVEAIAAAYGPRRFAHVDFCPHAAVGAPTPAEPDATTFADRRPLTVLFTGSWYRPSAPSWRELDGPARQLLDSAYEIALSHEFIPAVSAVEQAMMIAGLDPQDPAFTAFKVLANGVHEQVRMYRREEMLKAAARIGMQIFAVGRGWEDAQAEFPNLKVAGEASIEQAVALMQRSRVVLNVNANFGAGSHERPLTAMVAGAAAASDHSRFWASEFVEGEEIHLYRWKALDEGIQAIAALSEDPERCFAMARAGQARAMAGHTWDHRVDTLLAAAQAGRASLAKAA